MRQRKRCCGNRNRSARARYRGRDENPGTPQQSSVDNRRPQEVPDIRNRRNRNDVSDPVRRNAVLAQEKRPASEAAHIFEPLPQVTENVRYRNGSPLNNEKVKERIKDCETRINGAGRLVVRKSGTEPVIRVMAEGDDEKLVRSVVSELVAVLKEAVA